MFLRTLFCLILLFIACPAPAAPPPFEPAALQADAALLQRIYETLHPGLYRYNTPDEMAARFATLRRDLDKPQSLASAYLAFSRFAATVRCGHTYANFYNQSDAVRQALLDAPPRVPFYFRWIDGRMIVTRDFSREAALPPGTEVLAIGGVPAKKILARLMPLARADGHNDAKRIAYLGVQGDDEYEAFDIFLPLIYPKFAQATTYALRVRDASGERRVTVTALTYAQRLAAHKALAPAEGAQPWTLRIGDDGIAVLRMPTWALYESTWDWRAWLRDTFAELVRRDVRALVVDVRGNEGGLDVGQVLIAHLVERELALPGYLHRVRYRRVADEFLPYLSTWDKSFKDWGERVQPVEGGWYQFADNDRNAGNRTIAPIAPRYAGRVFALVGATNSSATFEFADSVKRSGLAQLVGQTTGGNRRGINGSGFFFVRLPNTGIELDLPLVGQFPLTPQPDAGIEPDIATQPTPADIASGRDVEMDAVRKALDAASAPR